MKLFLSISILILLMWLFLSCIIIVHFFYLMSFIFVCSWLIILFNNTLALFFVLIYDWILFSNKRYFSIIRLEKRIITNFAQKKPKSGDEILYLLVDKQSNLRTIQGILKVLIENSEHSLFLNYNKKRFDYSDEILVEVCEFICNDI
jgi:hypothetical protein